MLNYYPNADEGEGPRLDPPPSKEGDEAWLRALKILMETEETKEKKP